MKISGLLALCVLAHGVSAHCDTVSTAAIRQPVVYDPVESVTSSNITCNFNTPATDTISVSAGSTLGFRLVDTTIFHQGPAAIYLGQAPSTAAAWNGTGAHWFKIAEWGASFDPFTFTDFNADQLTTTIPAATPSGQYLARIEQIGLHLTGAPQWYISCAQLNITDGGTGNPTKVSIPGYVSPDDPGLTVNIYVPVPTAYTVPGPKPWTG